MKICFAFILVLLRLSVAHSQTISGVLKDSKSMEVVPFAHVFLNNTTIGTYSDENGVFEIEVNHPLSNQLEVVFSHTSYEKLVTKISSLEKDVLLVPRVDELFEVVVTTKKDKDWHKNVKLFEKEFFGYSFNSKHCTITNPEVLDFDKQNKILAATAFDVIKIKNFALGYEIDYYLDYFELNLVNQLPKYFGSYFVTEMDTSNFSLKKRWKKNRKKAYEGSFNHFVSALLNGTLEEEGYQVNDPKLISLKKKSDEMLIYIDGELEIVFQKEYQSLSFLKWRIKYEGLPDPRGQEQERSSQLTVIKPLDGFIHVADQKYVLNPDRIVLKGYMGWERMAEFIPNNYSAQ